MARPALAGPRTVALPRVQSTGRLPGRRTGCHCRASRRLLGRCSVPTEHAVPCTPYAALCSCTGSHPQPFFLAEPALTRLNLARPLDSGGHTRPPLFFLRTTPTPERALARFWLGLLPFTASSSVSVRAGGGLISGVRPLIRRPGRTTEGRRGGMATCPLHASPCLPALPRAQLPASNFALRPPSPSSPSFYFILFYLFCLLWPRLPLLPVVRLAVNGPKWGVQSARAENPASTDQALRPAFGSFPFLSWPAAGLAPPNERTGYLARSSCEVLALHGPAVGSEQVAR